MERKKFRLSPMVMSMVFILCSIFSMLMLCPNPVYATDPLGVTAVNLHVYANGNAITLKESTHNPGFTFIYLDSDLNTPVVLNGFGGTLHAEVTGADGSYNLSGAIIFGGSRYTGKAEEVQAVDSTSVTMLSGTVRGIYGGGLGGTVTGDTHVTVSGGVIQGTNNDRIFGGGEFAEKYNEQGKYNVGTVANTHVTISGNVVINGNVYGGSLHGRVTGNTDVTITGGSMWSVFGGGKHNDSNNIIDATVIGNTNMTITGGRFGAAYAGGGDAAVNGTATLEVSAGADIGTIKLSGEGGTDPTGGSSVTCEVAYYDGTTKLSDPASEWVNLNGKATKPSDLTAAGKTFAGWKKADGSMFDFDGAITTPQKIYAVWAHPVTYNGNGSTSGTVPTDTNTYATGTAVTLPGNTGNLTKTGYTFGGWSLTPNGPVVTSHTMGTTPITFYAVWTLSNQGVSSNISSTTSSSTGSGSLNTPAVMPFPANSNGTGNIVSQVQKAKDGESVVVNMNGTTTLKSEWLEEIAGKDVDIVLDMGNGVTWTINGKSITGKNFADIDLKVKTGTNKIPVNVINNITGESKAMQFTVTHSGEFGFTATISMDLGRDNKGLYANLFYYNEETKELEFIGACEIGANGSAAWDLEHTSTYAVVIDKVSLAPENVEAGAGVEANESLVASNVTDSKNNTITFTVLILISVGLVAVKFKKHTN